METRKKLAASRVNCGVEREGDEGAEFFHGEGAEEQEGEGVG